jgi:RNA polymerase sigma factor FliA
MTDITLYDEIAQETEYMDLVERHLGLVKRIAYHMSSRMPTYIQLNDLIQSGMIGLIEAAKNFKVDKGCGFETYAGIRIRGAILDDIRKNDWVPRSVYQNSRRITQAIHAVEKRENREAKSEEIAKELNVSINDYHDMLKDSTACDLFSLDDIPIETIQLQESHDDPLIQIQIKNLREILSEQISKLPDREQLVLSLHALEELNFKEIGSVLGISESRVCQIHSQAIGRLRSRIGRIIKEVA